MKTKIVSTVLLALSLICLPFTQGCKTAQQRQETFATLLLVSAAGMNAYVSVAWDGCKGDAVCQDNLNKTYSIYTNAVNAAITAFTAYENSPTNRTVFLNAVAALSAAEFNIVKAIQAAKK